MFGYGVLVDGSHGSTHDFHLFGWAHKTHFPAPLIIWWRKLFYFNHDKRDIVMSRRRIMFTGLSLFKQFEMACWVTPSVSVNADWVWKDFLFKSCSNSSSSTFLGWPGRFRPQDRNYLLEYSETTSCKCWNSIFAQGRSNHFFRFTCIFSKLESENVAVPQMQLS